MKQDALALFEEGQFEQLIEGLMRKEFGLCDNFFSPAEVEGLRNNLLRKRAAGLMHSAGIGRKDDFQKNTDIRGDVISWIEQDSEDAFEVIFTQKLQRFIDHLNRTCYAGINASEFHYAWYDVGSFYKRHLDQFKSNLGRKFSFIMYLNEDWQEADGGALSMYIGDGDTTILPLGGRAGFFRSDKTEHEVHPSPSRARMSIAGWLKK